MRWILVLLFGILTILFFHGKGAFPIADFHGDDEQNKRKCSRIMGGGMGCITVFAAVRACLGQGAPDWLDQAMFFGAVIVVIVAMILLNKLCGKTGNWRAAVVVIAFIVTGALLMTGHIKVSVEEERILIKGSYWPDRQVKLEEIESVFYREDFDPGRRVGGFGSLRLSQGTFRNEEFGSYLLYAYCRCDSYIILELQTQVVVVNQKTAQETKALYEKIMQSLE